MERPTATSNTRPLPVLYLFGGSRSTGESMSMGRLAHGGPPLSDLVGVVRGKAR